MNNIPPFTYYHVQINGVSWCRCRKICEEYARLLLGNPSLSTACGGHTKQSADQLVQALKDAGYTGDIQAVPGTCQQAFGGDIVELA